MKATRRGRKNRRISSSESCGSACDSSDRRVRKSARWQVDNYMNVIGNTPGNKSRRNGVRETRSLQMPTLSRQRTTLGHLMAGDHSLLYDPLFVTHSIRLCYTTKHLRAPSESTHLWGIWYGGQPSGADGMGGEVCFICFHCIYTCLAAHSAQLPYHYCVHG